MKKIICMVLCVVLMLCMVACGAPESASSNMVYAQIALPDGGVVEGLVSHRMSYGDGVLAITIGNTIYRTHYENVVLIEKQQ